MGDFNNFIDSVNRAINLYRFWYKKNYNMSLFEIIRQVNIRLDKNYNYKNKNDKQLFKLALNVLIEYGSIIKIKHRFKKSEYYHTNAELLGFK